LRPGSTKERKKKLRNMALKRNIWGHGILRPRKRKKSLRNMV
jgi:hypothetical protein